MRDVAGVEGGGCVTDGGVRGGGSYTGEWLDDKKHGQGNAVYPEGKIRRWVWEVGGLVRSGRR